MKILLTGANGTIGYEILKQLTERGEKNVDILLRSNPGKKLGKLLESNKEVTIISGDLTKPESLQKIDKTYDCVMHLAGIIVPAANESETKTRSINVGGTQNLIDRIEEISPNAHFLFSSSVTVYGDRVKTPDIRVGDEITTHKDDFYGWSKIDSEKIVEKSKLKTSIYRLSAIMGADNHKVSKIMFHVPLATQMEICTPEDTARAFVNSLDHLDKLENKVFNLGGGKDCQISYQEFLEKNFALFGMGKLNFPDKTFAEKNFHCGNYVDGDDLENIISFRKDTMDSYFEAVKASVPTIQRIPTVLLRGPIKYFLKRQSEPLKAWKTKSADYHRFFD